MLSNATSTIPISGWTSTGVQRWWCCKTGVPLFTTDGAPLKVTVKKHHGQLCLPACSRMQHPQTQRPGLHKRRALRVHLQGGGDRRAAAAGLRRAEPDPEPWLTSRVRAPGPAGAYLLRSTLRPSSCSAQESRLSVRGSVGYRALQEELMGDA